MHGTGEDGADNDPSRALGPYRAPRMGPKTGPTPAMFSSWMSQTFHMGIST